MKTAHKNFLILILASSLFIIIFYLRGLIKKTPKFPPISLPKDLSGSLNYSQRTGIYDSKKVDIPLYVFGDGNAKEPIGKQVLSEATRSDRWIEIDLSDQKLKAWEGNNLFFGNPSFFRSSLDANSNGGIYDLVKSSGNKNGRWRGKILLQSAECSLCNVFCQWFSSKRTWL